MELIGKDEELIDAFSKRLNILSGQLQKVSIYSSNYILCIDLDITLQYPEEKNCVLRFIDIQEYSFYHNSDHYFYNIERFKFFKNGDFFYISLDPYDEGSNVDENDQDFIVCRGVEGYFFAR